MPQMNKGGKYVFGLSLIREDGSILFPEQAIEEYRIAEEGRVYLFTGSRSTGGFCVTRKGLLLPSRLGKILEETPALRDFTANREEFVRCKGRSYYWTDITANGQIVLSAEAMDFLNIKPGMELFSIRSSDIAFTMGARGPLLEKVKRYNGVIPQF